MSRGTEDLGTFPPLFFKKHLYGSHYISKTPAMVRGGAGLQGGLSLM